MLFFIGMMALRASTCYFFMGMMAAVTIFSCVFHVKAVNFFVNFDSEQRCVKPGSAQARGSVRGASGRACWHTW